MKARSGEPAGSRLETTGSPISGVMKRSSPRKPTAKTTGTSSSCPSSVAASRRESAAFARTASSSTGFGQERALEHHGAIGEAPCPHDSVEAEDDGVGAVLVDQEGLGSAAGQRNASCGLHPSSGEERQHLDDEKDQDAEDAGDHGDAAGADHPARSAIRPESMPRAAREDANIPPALEGRGDVVRGGCRRFAHLPTSAWRARHPPRTWRPGDSHPSPRSPAPPGRARSGGTAPPSGPRDGSAPC